MYRRNHPYPHHELTADVHDLLPIMEKIGFRGVQASSMPWGVPGCVRGNRASQIPSSERKSI
jgi:hypothetical protein